MASATLEQVFTYHSPFGIQQERYVTLRTNARALAELIVELTPASREQSVALTKIQEAVMWANSAIAIHEKPPLVPRTVEEEAKFEGYPQCDGPVSTKESV